MTASLVAAIQAVDWAPSEIDPGTQVLAAPPRGSVPRGPCSRVSRTETRDRQDLQTGSRTMGADSGPVGWAKAGHSKKNKGLADHSRRCPRARHTRSTVRPG